jgi:hypothetical protein
LILSHLINPRNIDTPKSTHGVQNCQSHPGVEIPTRAFGQFQPVATGSYRDSEFQVVAQTASFPAQQDMIFSSSLLLNR